MSERETVKERIIKLNLSDADCDRILSRCGSHGISVGELLENFIGDLIDGTFRNGSDEEDFANRYFDRCWFGLFPKETLLHHFLEWGYSPEEFLDLLDDIDTAEADLEYGLKHPDEMNEEEMEFLRTDLADWKEEVQDYKEYWKPDYEPDMKEEIEIIKKWIMQGQELRCY